MRQLCAIIGGVFTVAATRFFRLILLYTRYTCLHTATHVQLCAIIGGVFTVAGIVASLTDKGINLVKKKELGKLG